MEFDPNNPVIKLCAQGMELEGQGNTGEANSVFLKAWEISKTDQEKFTSAHYVARHQKSAEEKLHWDKTALSFALKMDEEGIHKVLPSLYLNIGKCFEDLDNAEEARTNYELALSFSSSLPEDGYGRMILNGINAGISRISE